jgi:hypothetical protein
MVNQDTGEITFSSQEMNDRVEADGAVVHEIMCRNDMHHEFCSRILKETAIVDKNKTKEAADSISEAICVMLKRLTYSQLLAIAHVVHNIAWNNSEKEIAIIESKIKSIAGSIH